MVFGSGWFLEVDGKDFVDFLLVCKFVCVCVCVCVLFLGLKGLRLFLQKKQT